MNQFTTPDGVVTFPDGLPGFETCRRFVLVVSPELTPFTLIQGMDADGPSFVAIDPRVLEDNYPMVLDRSDMSRLGADRAHPLLWLAIVADKGDGTATANLRAPVVINPVNMRGIQVIAVDSRFQIDHPLRAA
jgi:flagellar assembly factor FliW